MPAPPYLNPAQPRSGVIKCIALAALLAAAGTAQAVASFDDVQREFRASDTLVLDRDGALLQRVRTDAGVRRGEWTALADISPALRSAMLLSEDQRFYEHSGVDWGAVSAAAWGNLWATRTRGASTITMQLAGLVDGDLQRRGKDGRTLGQKLGQTVAATQLEREWRKDQILEAYLNVVPFRGEIVGIDALSRTLFAKAPHGLDAREAAVAAALVRAPNARPALVAQRACELLRALNGGSAPSDCDALAFFTSAVLARKAFEPSEGIAPHFARRVLAAWAGRNGAGMPQPSSPPQSLVTTLRAPLQRVALAALQRQLRELRGRNVEDGAAVVLDNASGEVLAWVGSSGALSRAAQVDAVLAPRQPGSTLKPLLYAQAIAERRLTAASLLEDSSAQIATAGGLYIPQNYDRQFKGTISARTALGASLNVPAVRTLVMVSPDAFARQLRAAGIALAQGGDYYGYSLALGSSEVSLLALTNGYRTLANGGRYGEVRTTLAAPAPAPGADAAPVDRPRAGAAAAATASRAAEAAPPVLAARAPAASQLPTFSPAAAPVIDPRAAFIVGDILADANARARTFGLDSVLGTRFWSAVKTGTSKDMRDNWAVGWSERYTVGVWVGNASGAPMWDVSGTSGAAPVWAELMRALHRHEPSRAPAPPAGLVRMPVRFGDGIEAPREEWFIAGTEQPLFAPAALASTAAGASVSPSADVNADAIASANPGARILAPAPGTVIALDPDIPPRHQRLRLVADAGAGDQAAAPRSAATPRWRIDGKPLPARGPDAAQWLPWPGRHLIELVDARGRVLDSRRIEVRGAGVAAARAGTPAPAP